VFFAYFCEHKNIDHFMLKQQLNFKLSQKLSPQQIQLMKLIQLPTQAFEQRLKQEMEENPALDSGKEKADEYEDSFSNENTSDEDYGTEKIETDINVDEYLSDDEIPNYRLSSNNYSSDDDDLAFTQNVYTSEEKIEQILKIVHQLDPAGVGARNLQECLLIQLERKENTIPIKLASEILKKAFDHFSKKHYDKLLLKFDITEDDLKDAIEEIENLNPKPGGTYSGNNRMIEHVVPDFTIRIVDGELELSLNGRNAPELHVSREYNNMLQGYKASKEKSKSQKDAVLFIKQKLDAAKWFIEAVKQRQQTLFVTMSAIMHYQKSYFLSGDERTKYREQLDIPVARLRKKI